MKNLLIIPLIFFLNNGTIIEIPALDIEAITNYWSVTRIYVSETDYYEVKDNFNDVAVSWFINLAKEQNKAPIGQ